MSIFLPGKIETENKQSVVNCLFDSSSCYCWLKTCQFIQWTTGYIQCFELCHSIIRACVCVC